MDARNVRVTILGFLDGLPPDSAVQPTEIASRLGLAAEQINPFLEAARQNGEVIASADGSVRIAAHLKGQFVQGYSPAKVPAMAWNAAKNWEKGVVLICSVIFLAVLLFAALRTGEIPDRQFIILRSILALAGAGFTIGIPGFITARVAFKDYVVVRATGAIAVFVVIYFVPAAIR
jgi:hypothetical protein